MARGKRGGRGGIERNRGSPARGINTNRGAAARAPLRPVPPPATRATAARAPLRPIPPPATRATPAARAPARPVPLPATRATAARAPLRPVLPPASRANPAVLDGRSSLQRVDAFNYCQKYTSYRRELYKFLVSNTAYEGQLHATKVMNDMYHRSNPYAIHISHDDMWKFKANVGLIINTCNSRNDLQRWLLPTVRQFVRKFLSNVGTHTSVETIINATCLSLSGFPESMLLLSDFRKSDALVQRVPVFGDKAFIVATTFHGRHFMKTLLVGILAKHSHCISWGGNFCEEDIIIIKWRSKSDHEPYYTYEMKMLQKPVEAKGQDLHEAMVKDLLKAAAIFKPLYKVDQDWPVYFVELMEQLETVPNLSVGRPEYIEFLSYHPVLMLSAGRKGFLMLLRDDIRALGFYNVPTSLSNLSTYTDWTSVVQTEMKALNVFGAVFTHVDTHPYANTTYDLIMFLRNICQHVKQKFHHESELYLAQFFSKFLPSIMWILLQSGDMETFFQETWLTYKLLC